jgi:NMT1 family protein
MRKILSGTAGVAGLMALAGQAEAGTVRLCTGTKGTEDRPGVYYQVGRMIKGYETDRTKIEVVADTGGTGDLGNGNIWRTVVLDAVDPQACDAFIGQPDAVAVLKRRDAVRAKKLRVVNKMHREYVQAACGRDSGVSDLEDLEDRTDRTIALGPLGTGAWATWTNFGIEDPGYAVTPTERYEGANAMSMVANGEVSCFMRVAGLPDPVFAAADEAYGERIWMVELTDGDFNDAEDLDGSALYEWRDIPSGTYPALQDSWGSDAIETISMLARVYLNTDRVSDADADVFVTAVNEARKKAVAKFGG